MTTGCLPGERRHGRSFGSARQALRWLLVGGPGPLIADVGAGPVSARAVVAALGRAEEVIYAWSSRRLDVARARGVQHASMWAQYATATPRRDGTAPITDSCRRQPNLIRRSR
jgi:hypothetical protein